MRAARRAACIELPAQLSSADGDEGDASALLRRCRGPPGQAVIRSYLRLLATGSRKRNDNLRAPPADAAPGAAAQRSARGSAAEAASAATDPHRKLAWLQAGDGRRRDGGNRAPPLRSCGSPQ